MDSDYHRDVLGRVMVASLLGACGFTLAPGEPPATIDARVGDGAVDAPADAMIDAFIPLGPWSEPQPLTPLNTLNSEDDAALTADLLEIYFCSNRLGGTGGEDIWVARRATATEAFGAASPVGVLNSIYLETTLKVAPDGLTIMFASDRAIGVDLYVATRPTRADAWGQPSLITELNSASADYGASPSADLRRVVFSSLRTGDEELYVSTRATTAASWSAPVRITDVSTLGTESDPMEPDAQTLYFTSTRGGNLDIYRTQRTGETSFDPAAVPVAELNTLSLDRDAWVSADQRTIVFSSNRSGNWDLYYSTR